jgi:hypothetical protein
MELKIEALDLNDSPAEDAKNNEIPENCGNFPDADNKANVNLCPRRQFASSKEYGYLPYNPSIGTRNMFTIISKSPNTRWLLEEAFKFSSLHYLSAKKRNVILNI